MSSSLLPYGLHPARLLCPWDSPGKNTGVSCHALFQGNLPNPGIEPRSPSLQADSLPTEPPAIFITPLKKKKKTFAVENFSLCKSERPLNPYYP